MWGSLPVGVPRLHFVKDQTWTNLKQALAQAQPFVEHLPRNWHAKGCDRDDQDPKITKLGKWLYLELSFFYCIAERAVKAIQKRNETWLAQNPVIRDPQMFNHSEVAMGPASRELTYKIQKWNVLSDGLRPISWQMRELIGLPWRMMKLLSNFPSSVKASFLTYLAETWQQLSWAMRRWREKKDVFSQRAPYGKAPNHKESQFLFSSLGVVLRHSGATFCNQDANFGLSWLRVMPLWPHYVLMPTTGAPPNAIEAPLVHYRYSLAWAWQETPSACSFFFWLVAAWVKSRAERPSVSGVNRQLHVQNRMQIRN